MSLIKKLFTPSEEYNYRVIFISYCILSALCLCLYLGSLFWSDIKGFWIVLSPYLIGLPYYGYMWKVQSSVKEKTD